MLLKNGHSYDLDSFARVEYDDNKSETIYFGNLHHGIKTAIYLSGDNLTGEGEGMMKVFLLICQCLLRNMRILKKVRFFINI